MDAYSYSIKLLSLREHSEFELREKLKTKGYGDDEIKDSINRLIFSGYLSDERFAASFIRSRLRKNPEGKSILALRLKEKGISKEIIENALAMAWDDEEYIEPLKKAYEKLARKKDCNAIRYALYKKGFTAKEIKRCELNIYNESLREDFE